MDSSNPSAAKTLMAKLVTDIDQLEEALIFQSARGKSSSMCWDRMKVAKAAIRKLNTAVRKVS